MNLKDLVTGIVVEDMHASGDFLPRMLGPNLKTTIYKGSELAGAVARHPWHKLGGFFAEPRPLQPFNPASIFKD